MQNLSPPTKNVIKDRSLSCSCPFTDKVLKQVRFVGGQAGANSRCPGNEWLPANAFLRNSPLEWTSGKDENGNGEEAVAFPHLLWYEFKRAISPGRVSFRARVRHDCGAAGFWCGATKWQFVGMVVYLKRYSEINSDV